MKTWRARSTAVLSLLLTAVASAASAAQPQSSPERYSSSTTALGTLIDDPAARAILDKYVPGISKAPPMVRSATLKSLQGYALDKLSDDVLAKVDADLAVLTPISRSTEGPALRAVNVDEAMVAPYTLPDPLIAADGRRVTDAQTWREKRRPEIEELFKSEVYGRAPGRPADLAFDVFDPGTLAFGGKAIRKQVMIKLSKDPAYPQIQLVEYVPASAKKPVPVLLMIGFTTPADLFDDPGIRPGLVWDAATRQRKPPTQSMPKIDIDRFLAAGIGVAAFYYGDLDPDFPGGYPLGIRARYDKVDEAHRRPDAWGAISAWAWSLSRVQDYLQTDPAVDATRVAIFGASRLGKTVLWAAAQDERFAAVISCCAGKLGSGLIRRNFGGGIADAGAGTSYWLAPRMLTYVDRENELPVDGHMLLALIAPRPVLLQTGKYDHAADPKGEFLAAVAAGPVYELLGKRGLGTSEWPPREPILHDLAYTMNDKGHGVQPGDWDIYLQFLRMHLKP